MLAHYGGNITYHIPVTTKGGDLRIEIPHYRGAAVKLEVEGQKDYIVYPPYTTVLSNLPAGKHVLHVTLLGNRFNCFGSMHLADLEETWLGPNSWRPEGNRFTDSYRLKLVGVLSAPVIKEIL